VVLVQRLGVEKQVQDATQALLVESAHNALNDPEILDHSMEFATDVVGDDVVQQTAGEALYNTLSYAIRPTLSVCEFTPSIVNMPCLCVEKTSRSLTVVFPSALICRFLLSLPTHFQQFYRFWVWGLFLSPSWRSGMQTELQTNQYQMIF
jgi:hypothetical protein